MRCGVKFIQIGVLMMNLEAILHTWISAKICYQNALLSRMVSLVYIMKDFHKECQGEKVRGLLRAVYLGHVRSESLFFVNLFRITIAIRQV